MIPVPQRISASGWDGTLPGDCVKACVASVLERTYEEVPHFVAGEVVDPRLCADGTPHPDGPLKMDWLGGIRFWLRAQGYTCTVAYRSYFKEYDTMRAWADAREAAGIRDTTGRDCLWMYDTYDQAPYHEGYWIASVLSENFAGGTHAVVMLGSQVVFDPSPHRRQTPYKFVGEMVFIAADAARCRSAA